jgi:hypothetical protein
MQAVGVILVIDRLDWAIAICQERSFTVILETVSAVLSLRQRPALNPSD